MTYLASIKHAFPSSYTGKGFYSFFDSLVASPTSYHTYLLKGGPGTGKSSFLEQLTESAIAHQYEVEHFHSPLDPTALDALIIPELKVAFLNGMEPYTLEHAYLVLTAELIDFTQAVDCKSLALNKAAILEAYALYTHALKKATYSFNAASKLYESYRLSASCCIDASHKKALEDKLFDDFTLDFPFSVIPGKARHLFSSALTSEGPVDYLHTLIGDTKKIYFIKETLGCHSKHLMQRLCDYALECGLFIECYHSPLDPDKIEDLVIPELDCVITVSHPLHRPKIFPTHIYDLTASQDPAQLHMFEIELDRDEKAVQDLLQKGTSFLLQAQKAHEIIKAFYTTCTDFTCIDTLFDTTVEKVFPVTP